MNSLVPRNVKFGAAYYLEYQPSPMLLERDLDLMAAAHFTVIRVGESVWSAWEPENGRFELDWLQPVLDGAFARGISVVLGTPTYAVPPWLSHQYPEIAAETKTGQPLSWGARQEMDFTHPAYLFHAERIIRKVVARYAAHPAVIGFQVDNEPGIHLFHNRGNFRRFVADLRQQYGDVETLNREWGLVYWSHQLSDWAELWTPDQNAQPQYDLAYRRWQARCTSEFIGWQASIVAEYARDDQFVTTCIQSTRPALNDVDLNSRLTVAAYNPYYGMQDDLDQTIDPARTDLWVKTGAWGLLQLGDRGYAGRQERFLVTETDAQAIHGSHLNQPPYPGQLKQAGLALVAKGAAMIEYWHWHTLHFGTETYWGGILPHSQRPGRVYGELAELGALLETVGEQLADYVPDADVALLYSTDSNFALQFQPPLNIDGKPEPHSYETIFDTFYRGVVDAGAQARIIHVEQSQTLGADGLLSIARTLIVPAFYIASDVDLTMLVEYAAKGGHLVIGIRTGYADSEARARLAVAPDILRGPAGVWYEEFSNLDEPLPVAATNEELTLSPGASATRWIDGLIPDGAASLLEYVHPQHGRFPAVTTNTHGEGRISYVGTVPNRVLAADLMRAFIPQRVADAWSISLGSPVTVTSGRVGDTRRAWFVHNWSGVPQPVAVPSAFLSLADGTEVPAGPTVLDPWSVLALIDV